MERTNRYEAWIEDETGAEVENVYVEADSFSNAAQALEAYLMMPTTAEGLRIGKMQLSGRNVEPMADETEGWRLESDYGIVL